MVMDAEKREGKKVMSGSKLTVELPGLSKEMVEEIEIRIREFEDKHLLSVLRGGDGWVPKIRTVDYIIALIINVICIIWLIIGYMA